MTPERLAELRQHFLDGVRITSSDIADLFDHIAGLSAIVQAQAVTTLGHLAEIRDLESDVAVLRAVGSDLRQESTAQKIGFDDGREASRLRWTREKPQVSGRYFYLNEFSNTTIAEIWIGRQVYIYGRHWDMDQLPGQWAGPLPEPTS